MTESKMIIDKLYQVEKMLEGKRMMVIDDVCEYSRLSKSTVRRAVDSEELKHGKRKGKLIFRKQDVDNWLGL
jgi:excisionase family DNA binding protein|tara:strand:+ start:404 stop:619 length:216 start_codon:yes stop_codon:yes gene_type:complete